MVSAKKKVSQIGTHNGQFHCDEALACYMLKLLPEFKSCRIVRTRDSNLLKDCDIVVDVGAVYDPKLHRYDHHQKEFNVTINEIVPYIKCSTKLSSAGLVYAHFGEEVLKSVLDKFGITGVNEVQLKLLLCKVYENFIEEIDAVDNGVNIVDNASTNYRVTTAISSRIGYLNPRWNEESNEKLVEERFEKAMQLVGREFEDRVCYFANAWLPARSFVEKALADRFDAHSSGSIMVFKDVCPPWKDHLFNLESELQLNDDKKIYYVLYPDSTNGSWRVQCVPASEGSFTNRLSLPEEWRGVRDDKLSEISGIQGCIFVHSSGFIGGNLTFEGAMQMASKSLEQLKNK